MSEIITTNVLAGRAIAAAQAKDQSRSIPYRPEYNLITARVAASVLLQQISYWWHIKGKPFFKFRAPCSHDWYKNGDSWTEELGMTTGGFDTALKAIGAKVTKGTTKADLLKTNLVIYWTDSNRVTWYQLNERLFYALLYLAYNEPEILGNSGFRSYLDTSENRSYLYSKTTPEITPSSAAKSAAGEPPSEQPEAVREEANEDPLGDLGAAYKAKHLAPGKTPRAGQLAWADWGGSAVRARNGISAMALRRVGWLLEETTTLYPVDGTWRGWLKGLAQMYQAGRGDWEAVKAGIVDAWARESRYRPTHPVGFVGEIQKAWAVQHQKRPAPSGRRLVNVRDIPDKEL